LLFDNALPLTVDEVLAWQPESPFVETAGTGVMLTSPTDMVRVWPEVWPNRSAAKRALAEGLPDLPGFTRVAYQVVGPKMKRRAGWFDLSLIPDPRKWLADRLGPLAVCEFVAVATGEASGEGRATAEPIIGSNPIKEYPFKGNEPVIADLRLLEIIALFRRASEGERRR
jgi:hypothetical protein